MFIVFLIPVGEIIIYLLALLALFKIAEMLPLLVYFGMVLELLPTVVSSIAMWRCRNSVSSEGNIGSAGFLQILTATAWVVVTYLAQVKSFWGESFGAYWAIMAGVYGFFLSIYELGIWF